MRQAAPPALAPQWLGSGWAGPGGVLAAARLGARALPAVRGPQPAASQGSGGRALRSPAPWPPARRSRDLRLDATGRRRPAPPGRQDVRLLPHDAAHLARSPRQRWEPKAPRFSLDSQRENDGSPAPSSGLRDSKGPESRWLCATAAGAAGVSGHMLGSRHPGLEVWQLSSCPGQHPFSWPSTCLEPGARQVGSLGAKVQEKRRAHLLPLPALETPLHPQAGRDSPSLPLSTCAQHWHAPTGCRALSVCETVLGTRGQAVARDDDRVAKLDPSIAHLLGSAPFIDSLPGGPTPEYYNSRERSFPADGVPTTPPHPKSPVSGRQLKPEEAAAETAEDHSVTEGSVVEIIRPRPQGSSPVYEYVTEGASFGLPEDTPRRRRSLWKRDSGDSQTLSRMSHLESTQEATEETLKTKVEAGASGYIVTGGGDQGIFVKQVLKESSAANFSLREGDQLLSTTIFFDDITYEDALKILQYSEPYKVQFTIKRQLPAREDEEGASGGAQRGSRGSKKQDQDIADGRAETPTETLQEDGDQERLISKPREGRGRQPHRERLSWPKFQALKSKRGPGPRRSHSSSEAYERGDVPDLSPTSTDTEAQLPEAGPGRQRKRSFPNLRFRVGSGKGLSGRGAHRGTVQAGVLVETGPWDSGREAARVAAHGGREDRTAGAPEDAEPPTEPGLPIEGALGEGAGPAPRLRRKTKEARDKGETVPQRKAGVGPAPRQSREGAGEGTQALEIGIARLSLQASADRGSHQNQQPEFHVRIPTLKTPRFGLHKEKVLEKEGAATALQQGPRQRRVSAEGMEAKGEDAAEAEEHRTRQPPAHLPAQEGGETEEDAAQKREDDSKGGGQHVDEKGREMKMPRFKLPSFGWSPAKEAKGDKVTQLQETEKEKESSITVVTLEADKKGKDGQERDSKFKMPKFKMPSFAVSAPRKSVEAAEEVSVPKAQAEVTRPSVQADGKTSDLSIELPSAELEVKATEVGVKLPEGDRPKAEPKEAAAGIGLKGRLPRVQMPSIKAPRVDIRAAQVDIKGLKLDLQDAKGEVTTPDVEVSLASVEVDTEDAGSKLEGDVSLGDKEVAARDSKFKMPKFKMPSFRVSAPSKSVEATVEVTPPSVQADNKTSDLSFELPSTELEVKATEVGVKLPESHIAKAEPQEVAAGIGVKGHLPKVQMPSIKMPKVDIKGPKLDLQDAKGEVTTPDVEVSLASVEVDTEDAGSKLEGDVSLGDKEVAARDSKFKMPKFKMPSFRVSAPSKSVEATVEVTPPSVQADNKTSDLSFELPSTELEVKATEVGVRLPEGHIAKAEPKEVAAGIGVKGHLPKVLMPSIKVDIKGPKLDLKDAKGEVTAPDMEVSLRSVEVDTQAAGIILAGDVSLGDKEVAARDSKFKMPKFKMPSVGLSAPSKSVQAAVEVSVPKAQAEVTLPSVQADVKTSDLSIELPSAELDVKAVEVGVKLPEGHLPEAEPKEAAAGIGLKGHLPKVPGPSIKVPEVDIKAPQVDIKGPKLELQDAKGEVTIPDVEVSLPSMEVDTQAAGTKLESDVSLGDKEVAARDSKFKMPKFKMPSFGVSAPRKSVEAAEEVSVPKAQAEVTRPSVQADGKTSDLSIELPSAELEVKATEVGVKLPEGDRPKAEPKEAAAGIGLKGRLPRVQMPSIKAPRVDIRAAQVDIKGLKLDLQGAKGEVTTPDVEVSLASVEVDTEDAGSKLEDDVSLGDKEVAARDSKFKMPKFKMPSFRVSAPSKSVEATVEVTPPSVQADNKTSDLSFELPSTELEVKATEVGVKLPESHIAKAEPQEVAAGIGVKGHLPKVQMPSIKMPKVDIKGPKLDLQDAKGEVTTPDVEVSLASVEVDTEDAGSKLEGDVSLGDKEVAARDSKFKMPKFKMPSVGLSAPSKSVQAAVEVSVPKAQAEVTLPSVQADVKTSDLSIELPSAELDVKAVEVGVKLPEGHLPEAEPKEAAAGIGLKGHLPKVPGPSIKVPEVDIKAPQVDIKGPKLDLKDAKVKVTASDVEMSLPSVEVDTQAAAIILAGDVSLGDKEVAARDSKFKMPKFKMPSVGVSAPSKSVKATVEVSLPKAQAKVTQPSVQADGKTSELSIELPSAELEVKATEVGVRLPEGHIAKAEPKEVAVGTGVKGHLPKVLMPSIKVPKVDIKGPKLDLKDAKGEVTAPDMEVSLRSVEVDTQAAGIILAGDVSLGDKEVAARDSKFKMPKFKMPSVGLSAPSKSVQAAVEVSVPKAQAEVTLPSVQADVKTSDLSIELPSAELDVKAVEVGVKLPEGHLPEAEPKEAAAGIGLKGHLPKVPGPSIKVPEVDIKAPQVDIKGPKLELQDAKGEVTIPDVEVSLPSMEVDTQAAGTKLESDVSLGDKEVAARDSKFKMPKFKMPSFGVSAPRKSVEAAEEVSVPKAQAEVTRPSVQADGKTSDLSIELPSAELEVKATEVGVKLPEGDRPKAEPKEAAAGIGLKGRLPRVQMPSIKAPRVDIRAAQVDIKGLKLDLQDAKGEVTTPDVEVSLASVEVDTEDAGSKLEGDVSLGDKEVAARDSKFKMPKFKMPSFRVSAPSKSVEATVEVTPPSVQADNKTSDLSFELPSTELEVKATEVGVKLPESHIAKAEPQEVAAGIGVKGHLPKVQMPSIKMPKVDIKGPKLDLQDAKGEVTTPDVEVSLASVEVDTEDAGSKLEGDVSLGDKEVAARDSKFKMPKFKMPSFRVSAPSKSVEATVEVTPPSVQADNKTSDLSFELPSTELEVKATEVGVKLPESHIAKAEPQEVAAGIGVKGHLPKVQMPSIKMPKVDIKGPKLDLKDAKRVVLTKYQVTLPGAAVSPELPLEAAPCSQNDAYLPSSESSASLPAQERVAASQTDSPAGPLDPMFLASYGRVSFPKFHPPKFGFSVPEAADAEVEAGAGDCAPFLSTTGPARGLDSAAMPRSAWPSAVAAGETPAKDSERGGKDSPLKMPWIKLPSFRWSPKKGAVPPEDPERSLDDAELSVAVDTGHKGAPPARPASAVEVAVAALPEKAGEASGMKAPGCAVLEHAPVTEPHLSPAGAPAAVLSPSEARVHPGAGSLPLQMPSGRLPGTQAPPAGPAGLVLAVGQGRAEEWSSQPEGPIKLKASRTDGPSQVSVVNMGQPWEGSVVTVRLPRLSMPRFAFPDPSSEADVFIPAVTEVRCPGSSLAHALHEESPGVWGASILKAGAGTPGEQPVALDVSPEASPISKVRVHIQRAQGESPEVAVHSRATAELADLSGPEAISTRVVRQLEIPASEIQTASYGFSLLKVKMPEPRTRVSVRDSRLREGLQEASKQAALGAEPASGGLQPDTGEPFEVISPSVNVPGRPMFTPKVHSGHRGADSCSDKDEAAEVLAFPPKEDSGEAAAPLAEEDTAPREKPEGKRSGLFRFWLLNIGFSSSAEEPRADSKGEARAAAAQTQPGARPEAELPKKPQKTGWSRFPSLGLASSPTKKGESSEDEAALAEQNPQEQAVVFFDAPESFSPEGEGDGGPAETAGARAMATSTARTGLVLLEQDPEGGMHLRPGPPPNPPLSQRLRETKRKEARAQESTVWLGRQRKALAHRALLDHGSSA
ncbi:PREDICTED: protein AHNAK2 [Lipotes vexillifer]|uniref:Protein AHNAK2 n=1 Tax=Lipotes vexillifer TaxID=118797 RepID=A0A340X9M4_LIPVE|nr:PREDICTED: protein AHNAK2 [Lipotes vexillifer]